MTWITTLIELLGRIPPAFWGVVAGSFFSLGGVLLTNRANLEQLRIRFSHERELRARDRELTLRKEIYLGAAEAIYAGFLSVAKFGNLDIPQDKLLEGYLEKAPAIAKVQIVAAAETWRGMSGVLSELSATFLKLTARRIPLSIQRQQVTQLDEQISNFGKSRDQVLELMRQHNIEGRVDQRRWDVLQGNFNFEAQRISEAIAQRGRIMSGLYAEQLKITEECVGETMRLHRLLVPVIVAVRQELDFPIDAASYTEIIEALIAQQSKSLSEFLKQARTFVTFPPTVPGR